MNESAITDNHPPSSDYNNITFNARELLFVIINIITAILIQFIYPTDNFGNLEIVVSLTLFTSIVSTYYYITLISNCSTRSASILHLLVLLNIILASIVIDQPFVLLIGFSLFIFLSLYLDHLRSNYREYNILVISSIGLFVSNLIYWYVTISDSELSARLTIDFTVSQLLVFIFIFGHRSIREYKIKILSININPTILLPVLMNILLSPITNNVQIDRSIDGINILFFSTQNLLEYRVDIQSILFGIFLISMLLFSIRAEDQKMVEVTIFASVIYFILQFNFLLANDFIDASDISILNNNLRINIFSIIYLLYMFILLFANFKYPILRDKFTTFSSLFVTLFIINTQADIQPSRFAIINLLFLGFGVIIPALSHWKYQGRFENYFIIVQTLAIFLLAFIPSNSIENWIVNFISILFAFTYLFMIFRGSKSLSVIYSLSGSISFLIFLNVVNMGNSNFNVLDGLTMVMMVIILIILEWNKSYILSDTYYGSLIQIVSLFTLTFIKFDNLSSFMNINYLDILYLVWVVNVIVWGRKHNSRVNIMKSKVISSNSLVALFVVFQSVIYVPHIFVFIALISVNTFYLTFSDNSELHKLAIFSQALGVIFMSFLPSIRIIDNFDINWLSIAVIIQIVPSIILSFRNNIDSLKYYNQSFLAINIFFALFSVIANFAGLSPSLPNSVIIGLLITSLLLNLVRVHDTSINKSLIEYSSINIVFYSLYNGITLMKLEDILAFSYLNVMNIPDFSVYTLFYLVNILILIYYYITNLNGVGSDYISNLILVISGSLAILSVISYSLTQVPIFLLVVVTLFILWMTLYHEPNFNLISIVLSSVNLIVMAMFPDQIAIKMQNDDLPIFALAYLLFVIFIVKSVFFKNISSRVLLSYIITISTTLLIILRIINLSVGIPIEILAIGILINFSLPMQTNIDREKLEGILLISLPIILLLIFQEDFVFIIHSFISIVASRTLVASLIFFLYSGGILLSTINMKLHREWIGSTSIFLVVEFFVAQISSTNIHPISISLILLAFSLNLIKSKVIFIREWTPILQFVGMTILIARSYKLNLYGSSFSIHFIQFTIWVFLLLGLWYKFGIESQLLYSFSSIFALGFVYILSSRLFSDFSLDLPFILFNLILTTLFSVIFYSRVKTQNITPLFLSLITSQVTLFYLAQVMKSSLYGSEELIYRLLLDWVIFIPIFIETVIYLKPIVEQYYHNSRDENKGDTITFVVILLFGINALLIGSEKVFVVKLIVIAITLWIFSGTIIRPKLAWFSSLFTVFVYGFFVAQLSRNPGAIQETEYTQYFMALTVFGILMAIAGIINEKKYVGEPFTASLTITGSLLTSIAVITPLFLNDPFPLVDRSLGLQIVNFLPNVIWAIQGLVLFVLSRSLDKGYLRRIALSILLVDIVKTGYNVIFQTENDLIKIIGALVLGGVLILIFYLFSSDEAIEQNVVLNAD